MAVVAVVLGVVAAALAVLLVFQRRRYANLYGRFLFGRPGILRDPVAQQAQEDPTDPTQWVFVAKGGDTDAGEISGLGMCPCRKHYTVKTDVQVFAQRPAQARLQQCLANPPATPGPEDQCKDYCVMVRTHTWNGFWLEQNTVTGRFWLQCSSFAQYHCKKPTDPDVGKPPKPHHPDKPPVQP